MNQTFACHCHRDRDARIHPHTTYIPLEGEGEGEDHDGGSGACDDDDEEGRDAGGEQGAEEHHVEAVDALHGEEATYGDHVGARDRHRHAAAAQHPP